MAKDINKNAKRRARMKAEKAKKAELAANQPPADSAAEDSHAETNGVNGRDVSPPPSENAVAESVQALEHVWDDDLLVADNIDEYDPLYQEFQGVFQRFNGMEMTAPKEPERAQRTQSDGDVFSEGEEEEQKKTLSKKARKKKNMPSIAELKSMVKKPDMVEWTDTSAPDPPLLVALKSSKNVVPVPSHWSLKREYLSSKRGIEKPPFALPKFIAATGIAEMRDAALEKNANQTLKQKQRERVQGKTGKMDIDYQKLYEAFFKFQTKPELTRYGEVYYEGKEYETNLRHLRPGELSLELKDALSIPPGAPPPWLINMQRFGPPPAYPKLKIPGLNAPPPPGSAWGFHPGGYGKPPTDEQNRPLYGGDIFGVSEPIQKPQEGEPVDKSLWGELPPREESESEEEDTDEEDLGDDDDATVAPSGMESVTSGIASTAPSEFHPSDVAGEFTLRKQRLQPEATEPSQPRSAFQVLPEQSIRTQGFFGGSKAYDLKAAKQNLPTLGQEENSRKRKAGDIDVSVDVDALAREDRLSKDEINKQYEQGRQQENKEKFWGGDFKEDLSEMIAEESRKRLKKDDEKKRRK